MKKNSSEETIEKVNEEIIEENQEEVIEEDPLELLKVENEKLKLALDFSENKYLKAHADLENTKKRLINDFNQRDKYKISDFALSLLPVLDNMEKVLADYNQEENPLIEAIEMIYRQLLSSLHDEGISEIEALDKPFNPNVHQAVMMEEIEGKDPDMVVEVLQKGYKLKDRILRASMVKVSN